MWIIFIYKQDINMYKKGVLNNISTSVSKIDDTYVVRYEQGEFIGECIYKMLEMSGNKKPIKQSPLLMVHCSMGDIIEKLHMNTPLTSEDFQNISMDIRNHSLIKVEEFLNELS
jgi:hypothetical protein